MNWLSDADVVLFDVADTLLYKAELFETIASCLQGAGIARDPKRIRAVHTALREKTVFPDKTDRSFYGDFNCSLLQSLDVPPTKELAHEIYMACRSLPWRPFADVAFLASLKARLGIVSNWDARLIDVLAEHIPIDFDPVVVSAVEGVAKPDMRIFEIAVSRGGGGNSRAFFVGDSPKLDIVPARNAGLTPILIDRFDLYSDFPGLRVSSLEHLDDILSR